MVPWASAEKRNARSQDIHPETQLADATFDPGQLVTIWEVTIKKNILEILESHWLMTID